MKQNLQIHQTLQHKYILQQDNRQSLEILKMDSQELRSLILQMAQKNPMFTCKFSGYGDMDYLDTMHTPVTLKDELYYQLHTLTTPCDYNIASLLIESIDERGYLTDNLQDIADTLQVTTEEVQQVLNILQTFEPAGVFAKDTAECLALQCERIGNTKGAYLLTHYAYQIEQHDLRTIAKDMKISMEELRSILSSLRQCDPHPCASYSQSTTDIATPEVDIYIEDDEVILEPCQMISPHLHDDYISCIEEHPQLKTYFQEASILIDTINRRNVSLLMIINELVNIQKGYFLYHDELRPCTLKDIAEKLSLHESTVSRALHQKYYRFQGECYPLKHLFTSMTSNGDSADGIRKAIKEIIQKEDKQKPYSDQQLVIKLSAMDLKVSRRTVVKYREQMKIPNSTQRRIR